MGPSVVKVSEKRLEKNTSPHWFLLAPCGFFWLPLVSSGYLWYLVASSGPF
jgi:hypothetical protein